MKSGYDFVIAGGGIVGASIPAGRDAQHRPRPVPPGALQRRNPAGRLRRRINLVAPRPRLELR